jgi:hypothetical protein
VRRASLGKPFGDPAGISREHDDLGGADLDGALPEARSREVAADENDVFAPAHPEGSDVRRAVLADEHTRRPRPSTHRRGRLADNVSGHRRGCAQPGELMKMLGVSGENEGLAARGLAGRSVNRVDRVSIHRCTVSCDRH